MNSKFLALAVLMMASILVLGCTSQNQNNASGEKVKVNFEVSYNEKTDKLSVFAEKGSNAFEIMKANLQVDFKDSAIGPFITGINNINADTEHYWALYIDGNYAQKGINQYTIEKETIIAWKLEKIDLSQFS